MSKVKDTDIQAIKLIFDVYEDKQNLINMQCAKYKLTEEFMIAFAKYVTPEAFSKSPNLEYEMIQLYQEFFDMNFWVESTEKSLEPLMHDFFHAGCGDLTDEAIKNARPEKMTIEFYKKFEAVLTTETKQLVLSKSTLAQDEEILIGSAEFLTRDVFKNRRLDIKWSTTLIEKILRNKVLTVRFLMAALSKTKDIFFIERILADQTLTYEETTEMFDVEFKNFTNRISENQLGAFFDIVRAYNPAAFTYNSLKYILMMKDLLSEDFLSENSDLFMEAALFSDLVRYARRNNYMDLLLLLKLNENNHSEEEDY